MTIRITNLWSANNLPIRDGLYRADGTSLTVEIDGPELNRFNIGDSFDLNDFLGADPELQVTAFDILRITALPNNSGFLCCGDGAYGSHGFISRLDPEKHLVWAISLGTSNPFEDIAINGATATFTNNLGNSLTLDLARPEFGPETA